MKYELVAGFETHIELSTKTKIFCGCTTQFGGEPNSHCCPVCIGLPGALPTLNRQAVRYGAMAGLATNCTVAKKSRMDRKNYSYPDLPKAYQISQFDEPLCKGGYVELESGKKIRINRIHIEEDAGKLIHKDEGIYIDYNRAGVPLIEIVTEPDIRSVDEAKEYVEKLQNLMRYIGISDCRMQEGSMRCDVNISVRRAGEQKLGVRTEIKNMNSISNIARAMEYEFKRQCELLEKGEEVVQETLRFDDTSGTTSSMRSKEDAHDYRFFPEPDLPEIYLSDREIEEIAREIPELPEIKANRYMALFGISKADAQQLTKYRAIAEYFDKVAAEVKNPRTASNFIISQMFGVFKTETEKEYFQTKVTPDMLCELLKLLEEGKINKTGAKLTLEKMLQTGKSAMDFLSLDDLQGLSSEDTTALCKQAISINPSAVNDYKNGKEKALMSLLGFVMRESRGKADAKYAEELLRDLLK